MNNIQIKTKVYTNLILEEIQSKSGKTIHYDGILADAVRDILSDDGELDAIVRVAWDEEGRKGVCPFTPEQLLDLAPHGFNPCPIDLFLNGFTDLKNAVEECFSVTMSSVWDDDEWAENKSEPMEELDFDLFHEENGNGDIWLATDKDGEAICDLCAPICDRHKSATKKEKKSTKKQVKN